MGLNVVLKCFDETEHFIEIIRDMEIYQKLNPEESFSVDDANLKIITADKYMPAGMPPAHYFV